MISNLFYNISFLSILSLSTGALFVKTYRLYNYFRYSNNINSSKNALNLFLVGFNVGLGVGISYIATGKPLLYNLFKNDY